jgi:hypothetical protein
MKIWFLQRLSYFKKFLYMLMQLTSNIDNNLCNFKCTFWVAWLGLAIAWVVIEPFKSHSLTLCVEPNSWLGGCCQICWFQGLRFKANLVKLQWEYMGRVVGTPCMCECSMHKWIWKNIFIVSEIFFIFELFLFCQFVISLKDVMRPLTW